MSQNAEPRTWLEIDHRIVRANFEHIAAKASPSRVLAVLKADAYGLGALPIAKTLLAAGAARIGVAVPGEASELAELGCDIQLMSAVLPEEVPELIRHGVILPVTDLAMARLIGETATRMGMVARGHVKIDSGMGRLGILIEEADDVVPACCAVPGLEAEGIFTHFPMDYVRHGDFTRRQIDLFTGLISRLEARGICFKYRHCANSDAINNCPEAVRAPFNLVRAGLNLHGLFDPAEDSCAGIGPVFSLKTRLIAVRELPAGRTIGYGATCRLSRPTRVGTIAAGYADGFPLALSNRGRVIIRGRACPIIGRISMDYTTVDLSQVPDAAVGDEVTCIGRDGNESVSAEEWARIKGTHPYDIICSFSPRVHRVHKNAD